MERIQEIIGIAEADANIRAAYLYGSRAESDVEGDEFQDYDIIYIVREPEEFDISVFRDVGLLFVPSEVYPELFEAETTCLMQFTDFSRVDLTICTLEVFLEKHTGGQALKCVIDKDNINSRVNTGEISANYVQKLSRTEFTNTCAEFFWEVQNMVKGLCRVQLSYTMFIRDISLRDMLNKLVDEYIGMTMNYAVSVGTLGKYRRRYLPEGLYEMYKNTYKANKAEDVWVSLYVMLDLFCTLAKAISDRYAYEYPENSERFVRSYLEYIENKCHKKAEK